MIVYSKGLIAPRLYRIADLNGPAAELRPVSLGAVPMQSPLADLRRYRIRTTDEVTRKNGRTVRIIRLLNPLDEDTYQYEVETANGTDVIPEYELTVHEGSLAPDPADMLGVPDLAPWRLVDVRAQLMDAYFKATARSLGIVGYNGARMLPIPHQINAARYALQFGRVRFILADEVGLGKTIEAGLIANTLRKYNPGWQAAVFVPESLTAQWSFEMYSKFGKALFAITEDDFDEDSAGIVLPHEAAIKWSLGHEPEILIVDEAHRTLADVKTQGALRRLSRKARAVLLLTATPVADDYTNLLKLYQLLDPEQFGSLRDPAKFRALQDKQAHMEEFLRTVRDPDSEPSEVHRAWGRLGVSDNEMEAHLADIGPSDSGRHERHRTAALAVDRYYPGARLLRYRRKFLARENALPFRIVSPIEYRPLQEETDVYTLVGQWLAMLAAADLAEDDHAQRLTMGLLQAAYSSPMALAAWVRSRREGPEPHVRVTADPILLAERSFRKVPSLEGEAELLEELEGAVERWSRATRAIEVSGRQLARAPRYTALLDFLMETYRDEPSAHVLLFTGFEANVHPLFLLLRKALQGVAEVYAMSGLHSRQEREKSAFEFQEQLGPSLLISDELGGEGRNFQFATHVVHFDLPPAPWTVEQRIGRCDRVGRSEEMDVDSQVIVAKGHLDEALFDFLADGVGVFNESIAPVEGELDHVMRDTIAACIRRGATGVLERIEEIHSLLEEARERENKDLLVRSAVGVEEARRIARELDDSTELEELRRTVCTYARHFESMVDERPGGAVAITVGEFHSLHAIPGVRSEMVGYFDRVQAVRHERMEFFSPGHPFIRSLVRVTMEDSPDRCAIVAREGLPQRAFVFDFRLSLAPEFFEEVLALPLELRPPLLTKSAHLFSTRMLRIAVSEEGEVVPRIDENAIYYDSRRESDTSLHDHPELLHDILPGDWAERVSDLSWTARERAEELAEAACEEGREEFEDLLCEVLARIHPEHALAESQISAIMMHVDSLDVNLDAAYCLIPANETRQDD